ncbi:MAG: polysaccharide biosynthesis tyrosine autokinase [Aquabacterium commune]|uniref:polysaccharide biosynthesis tyrosine autokinase n=1 Tax=Aquabacterium TaxID=92793 RepID=UPI001D569452|nr:polysaccharide biosynthesis tyrosine autokinase [Aquabacterium sp.]MBT9611046.1 polysaccharide biosynthesis tyrosine autokinase [Aquabacterium sp.]
MNDFESNPQAQSVQDPSLGDILRRTKGLTSEQVAQALEYQRSNGVRFGAAVVALGLAQTEDVIWALSQQFHYPYTPVGERTLNEELVVANTPFDDNVEAFRDLRTQLLTSIMGPGPERSALAIVSADVAEGKTFVAANLATAFSQLPGRTLVIDADLRTPRLHEVFGAEASTGLSGILAGRTEANVIRPVSHLPNLYLLPAGTVPPNPTELLQRAAMSLLLRELLSKFDNVLVDTPAASHGPDARIIAMHCGAAMLVGRKRQSKTADMQALLKHLTKSNIKIAGVLVNEF